MTFKQLAALGAALALAASTLTSFGYKVMSPTAQVEQAQIQANSAIKRIELKIDSQAHLTNDRIQLLERRADKVDALVRVKCVETRNALVRDILGCQVGR